MNNKERKFLGKLFVVLFGIVGLIILISGVWQASVLRNDITNRLGVTNTESMLYIIYIQQYTVMQITGILFIITGFVLKVMSIFTSAPEDEE